MVPATTHSTPSPAEIRQEAMVQPVEAAETAGRGEQQITRNDLTAVSTDLKHHITSLLESNMENINSQLKSLSDSMKGVADTANKTYEMAAANIKAVEDIKTSKKSLKDRLSVLELKSRALRLKFRGFPELAQINENLLNFMTNWIASLLQQGEGVSSIITAAYGLGVASQARPNYPRDILIQFQHLKDKEMVLSLARGR